MAPLVEYELARLILRTSIATSEVRVQLTSWPINITSKALEQVSLNIIHAIPTHGVRALSKGRIFLKFRAEGDSRR